MKLNSENHFWLGFFFIFIASHKNYFCYFSIPLFCSIRCMIKYLILNFVSCPLFKCYFCKYSKDGHLSHISYSRQSVKPIFFFEFVSNSNNSVSFGKVMFMIEVPFCLGGIQDNRLTNCQVAAEKVTYILWHWLGQFRRRHRRLCTGYKFQLEFYKSKFCGSVCYPSIDCIVLLVY